MCQHELWEHLGQFVSVTPKKNGKERKKEKKIPLYFE